MAQNLIATKELDDVKAKSKELFEERDDLLTRSAELFKERGSLLSAKSVLVSSEESLKNQMVKDKIQSEVVAAKVLASNNRILELEGQVVKQAEASSVILESERGNFKKYFSDLNREHDDLKVRSASMMRERDDLSVAKTLLGTRLSDMLKKEQTASISLQKSYDALLTAKATSDDRILSIELKMKFEKKQLEDLAESKADCDRQITVLKGQLFEEKATSTTLKQQSTTLEKTVDDISSAKVASEKRVFELEAQIKVNKVHSDKQAKERIVLDNLIVELKSQMRKHQETFTTLAAERDAVHVQLEVLREDLESKTAAAAESIKDLKASFDILEEQGMKDKSQLETLSESEVTLNDRIAELESHIKEEEDASDLLAENKLELEERFADLQTAVIRDQKQLDTLSNTNFVLEERIIKLEFEMVREMDSSGVLTNERDAIQTRFIDLNKRFEDLNKNLAMIAKDRDYLSTKNSILVACDATLNSQMKQEKNLYNQLVTSKGIVDKQIVAIRIDMATSNASSVSRIAEFEALSKQEVAASIILKKQCASLQSANEELLGVVAASKVVFDSAQKTFEKESAIGSVRYY